ILHLALVERRPLDVLFRSEFVVGQSRRADVPHPGLNVRALIAGREMVEVENAKQVRAELDEHPLPKPCRLYRAHDVVRASNEWLKPFDRSTYGRGRPNMLRCRTWPSRGGIRCAICSPCTSRSVSSSAAMLPAGRRPSISTRRPPSLC